MTRPTPHPTSTSRPRRRAVPHAEGTDRRRGRRDGRARAARADEPTRDPDGSADPDRRRG